MESVAPALIAALGFLLVVALRRRRGACAANPGDDRSVARRILPFFLPLLITGGPGFIALPAAFAAHSVSSAMYYFALAGGVGLAIGLVMMFSMVMRQEREITRLWGVLETQDHTPAGPPWAPSA